MSPLRISVVGFPPARSLGSSSVTAPLACRSFSSFGLFHHAFFSEAQERGPERMEGRGLGARGGFLLKFLLVYVVFLVFLTCLRSCRLSTFQARQTLWYPRKVCQSLRHGFQRMISDGICITVNSVYMCVFVCVILFKVEKKIPPNSSVVLCFSS